jgi:hypothetical protein
MSPRWGSTPRLTDSLTVSSNVIMTVNLTIGTVNSWEFEKNNLKSKRVSQESTDTQLYVQL